MDKNKIRKYARWILKDIENAEHNVVGWIEELWEEVKHTPENLHKRIEELERKLEGK